MRYVLDWPSVYAKRMRRHILKTPSTWPPPTAAITAVAVAAATTTITILTIASFVITIHPTIDTI